MTLPTLSLINMLYTLALLLFTWIAYKYFIRPYYLIRYYQKQGGASLFHWKLFRYFDNIRNAAEKGDFFYIDRRTFEKNPQARFIVENFMSNVVLILHDLKMTEEYLHRHEIYQKDKGMLRILVDRIPEFSFFLEGAAWRNKRRFISSAFNYEFLKDIVPMAVEATKEKFNEWAKNGKLKDIDLSRQMGTITGEITARFLFGKRVEKHSINGLSIPVLLQDLFTKIQEEAATPACVLFGPGIIKTNILPRHRKLNKMVADLKACCREMIEETEKSPQKDNNALQVLLELRRKQEEQDRFTYEQIIDELIGLFTAGTDTTGHLVSSAIYFLWKNPSVQEKVAREVRREFIDLDRLTADNLNRMEYTTAFLYEAIRLGGPTGNLVPRVAVQDDDLCGVKVKKGTLIVFPQGLFSTYEKYFPNSWKLCPERWLPNSPFDQEAAKNEPYAFSPFMAGPKTCTGQHLGMIAAKVIIGLFIMTFNVEFPKDYALKMVQRFAYEPLDPLVATLDSKDV